MSAWRSVHLSACLSIYLSVYKYVCLTVCHLSACVFLTVCLLICMSVCLPVSVCPSTRPPVLPSVCLSVFRLVMVSIGSMLQNINHINFILHGNVSGIGSTGSQCISEDTVVFFKQKGFEIFPEIHKNLIRGRIYRISNRKMVSMNNSSQE